MDWMKSTGWIAIAGALLAAGCGSTNVAVGDVARWDWQLSDPMQLGVDVDVIDLDPDNVSPADIAALKARGVQTIAYVSVGTLENYRDDVAAFPASVVGKVYGAWPDEKFLDIRNTAVLNAIMSARFNRAKTMGFEAIEPDNMDVYQNDSGFTISAAETVTYVRGLADIAHGMGLEMGQKNVPELTDQLVDHLDFMIAESCYQDGWCDQVLAYVEAGKPVYDAEYNDRPIDWGAACAYANSVGISMVLKDRDLTGAAVSTC
ncbi:MAG: hypothetical protein ACJA06_001654 [Halocynthiibacter sp.]|jgi:hypothetical protein